MLGFSRCPAGIWKRRGPYGESLGGRPVSNSVLQLKKTPCSLPLMGEPWLPLQSFRAGRIRLPHSLLNQDVKTRRVLHYSLPLLFFHILWWTIHPTVGGLPFFNFRTTCQSVSQSFYSVRLSVLQLLEQKLKHCGLKDCPYRLISTVFFSQPFFFHGSRTE